MTAPIVRRMVMIVLLVSGIGVLVTASGFQSSLADPDENTWLRIDNDGDGDDGDFLVVDQITAYLLTTYNGPGITTFRGFHEPECSNGSGTPCETVVDNDGSTTPTYNGDIPGACDPCFEYKVTFSADTFVFGDNHVDATITNGAETIAGNAKGFTEHTFSVVPESPIGAAALILSSLAALGGFIFLRGRKSQSILNI